MGTCAERRAGARTCWHSDRAQTWRMVHAATMCLCSCVLACSHLCGYLQTRTMLSDADHCADQFTPPHIPVHAPACLTGCTCRHQAACCQQQCAPHTQPVQCPAGAQVECGEPCQVQVQHLQVVAVGQVQGGQRMGGWQVQHQLLQAMHMTCLQLAQHTLQARGAWCVSTASTVCCKKHTCARLVPSNRLLQACSW